MPQPLDSAEDLFAILGAKEKFGQDPTALQRRFFELSRALHPDRFSAAAPERKKYSLERMSRLNEAYHTLKNPDELRDYVLRRAGFLSAERKSQFDQLPIELAERWFGLQESFHEGADHAAEMLSDFESELGRQRKALEEKVLLLERTYDENPSREILEKIAQCIQRKSYLTSLMRDVSRLQDRVR